MSGGPQTLADRYELVSLLGRGGMGVVWRARDTRLGRAVAVKVLPADAVGNEVARARLLREARAAAALDHEGIVHVYDVGETPDGGAYLVMELIRGKSLREKLLEGSLTTAEKIATVVAAARALGFAHAAGIIHRDVKPDNIMLRDNGKVAVVDFGVAKPVSTIIETAETLPGVTQKSITEIGQLVGTPAYLAPEQATGATIDAAADQFALAVTAFEALTGKIPWSGKGIVEVVAAILRDDPPPISKAAGLPEAFDPVFARAFAKDPTQRHRNMDAFADALENAARAMSPSVAKRVLDATPGMPADTAAKAASTLTPEPTLPARGAARSRGRLALMFLGGAAACIAAVVLATRQKPAEPQVKNDRADVVACPPFKVTGMDDSWLGAAAATLACERIQLAHGGVDARTAVPAELLGAPRDLTLATPQALYDGPAREKAIGAVKAQSARFLDGVLEKRPNGFHVELALRDTSGAAVRHGEGDGIEIFEAVRDAIGPVIAGEDLTPSESASMREWLDVTSRDDLVSLVDMRTAILIEDPVSLKEACATIAKRTTLAPRVSYLARAMCARKLRTGPLADPPPPVDDATPGALITTSLAQGTAGGPEAVRARAERLEKTMESTIALDNRARLGAAAGEIYNMVGDERARVVTRRAIQASTKAYDWRVSHWHRIAFSSEGDDSLAHSMNAWQPWEPITQSQRVRRGLLGDLTQTTEYVRRGYLLSQRGYYANAYGEQLLTNGDIERARSIAELTDDDLLRIGILVSEAKYGRAHQMITSLIEKMPAKEENAALAFRLAEYGVRVGLILGRPADFVGTVVDRFVTSQPHHVVDSAVGFTSLVSACCFAPRPVGKKCIDRIRELREQGEIPTIYKGAESVLAGATRFVADDYAGAAKAWRQMLRAPGWIQDPLRDVMAVAFDRAGEYDLGAEIDESRVAAVDLPRAAELAWVRAAKRAYIKGDHARARTLAQAVVDKWRFADEDLPAMREMKDLLAKLPR